MACLTLTITMARAAGADAANRRMRADGRTEWNAADYRLAARTMADLIPSVVPEGVEYRVTTSTHQTHERLFLMMPLKGGR